MSDMRVGGAGARIVVNAVDLVEVERLRSHIDGRSYSATGIHRNGYLFVSLNIADWQGRSGLSLLIEATGLLWRAFKGTMGTEYVYSSESAAKQAGGGVVSGEEK